MQANQAVVEFLQTGAEAGRAVAKSQQVSRLGACIVHGAQGLADLQQAAAQFAHAIVYGLGRGTQRASAVDDLGTALVQRMSTPAQFIHALAQTLHTALGPCSRVNYQIPASFVEAVIDRMAQVVGKATRQESALVVVALGCVDHQASGPWLRAGHRVRTEVRRNDECKSQLPAPYPFACRGFVAQVYKAERVPLSQTRHDLLADVDLLPLILHGPVQVHQSDSQSLGMRGRIPYAGEVDQRVDGRHQGHDQRCHQQLGVAGKETAFQSCNGSNVGQKRHVQPSAAACAPGSPKRYKRYSI